MPENPVIRLDREQAQLLIVDIQEKLLPFITDYEIVVQQAVRITRAAGVLGLPVTVSEQYPQGLGSTTPPVRDAAGAAPLTTKMTFSYCRDEACRNHISANGRQQVLLVGIETHVCVQQTALDLLTLGMQPFVLADAVGSRRRMDYEIALERMSRAGVIITTVESAIFQMVEESGTQRFKDILPIVK